MAVQMRWFLLALVTPPAVVGAIWVVDRAAGHVLGVAGRDGRVWLWCSAGTPLHGLGAGPPM